MAPPLDIDRLRADTPAVLQGRIHLNNAGAALMPRPVVDAVREHLELESRIGGYEAVAERASAIGAVYEELASLLGARPRNIALVENATVAVAQALSAYDFGPGDVLLTTRNDYASNQIMYLSLERRRGVEVVWADDLPEGGVDPDSVRRLLDERRPKLVSLTWIPTNSGLVQPAEEVGRLCAEREVPYLLDGCQALGQLPIDVGALRCDFFAATGRKFLRGPRGTGLLWVSDRVLDEARYPLFLDMRGADWVEHEAFRLADGARRFENWEFSYALQLGLGAAARYALDVGIAQAGARAADLARHARDALGAIDGVRVLDHGARLCALATFALPVDANDAVEELRALGINTSATVRTSALLDMDDKGVATSLRISPHYYNTEREVDIAVEAVESLVASR